MSNQPSHSVYSTRTASASWRFPVESRQRFVAISVLSWTISPLNRSLWLFANRGCVPSCGGWSRWSFRGYSFWPHANGSTVQPLQKHKSAIELQRRSTAAVQVMAYSVFAEVVQKVDDERYHCIDDSHSGRTGSLLMGTGGSSTRTPIPGTSGGGGSCSPDAAGPARRTLRGDRRGGNAPSRSGMRTRSDSALYTGSYAACMVGGSPGRSARSSRSSGWLARGLRHPSSGRQ